MSRPAASKASPHWGSNQSLTDDPFPYRVQDQLSGIVQVEFLENVAAVGLDGIGADVEDGGYFFVGLSFRDQLKNFALSNGKQVIAIHCAFLLQNAHAIFRQDSADFGAEKRLVLRNG